MSTAAFKVDQVPSWLCVRRERACAVVHSVSWSVLTAHILCRSLSFLLLSYISPISESSNFLNISDNFEPFLTFLLKFVLLGVGSCRAFITWRKEKNIYNCAADWYKTQHIIGLTIREYWPRVHWHSKHSINSKSKFRRWEDLLLSYNSWVLAAGRAWEQCSTSCAGFQSVIEPWSRLCFAWNSYLVSQSDQHVNYLSPALETHDKLAGPWGGHW